MRKHKGGYYLMVKSAPTIKMKYLCKCADNKDPYEYKGSGKLWHRYLRKYDPYIITWVIGHYSSNLDLRVAGEYYSNLFDVVSSKDWANLIPETGDGGSTTLGKSRYYNIDTGEERVTSDILTESSGWVRGSRYNLKGYKYYYDPNTLKRKRFKDIPPEGWVKGVPKTESFRSGPKGKIIINDGKSIKYLNAHEEIPKGWIRGKIKNTKKVWINNGIEQKLVDSSSVLPYNFRYGALKNNGISKKIITPYGNFDSIGKCSKEIGMSDHRIRNFLKDDDLLEWKYLD